MNEQIKFRIYDKEFNQFSYLTFDNRGIVDHSNALPIDEKQVGEMEQYVRRCDKTKKDVYVGDIIKGGLKFEHSDEYPIMVIEIDKDEFVLRQVNGNKLFVPMYWIETGTIIGNIHQNPELIK